MSVLHEWERIEDVENVEFTHPDAPDMIATWRCKKCHWQVHQAVEQQDPPPVDKKLFRKLPNRPEEWYSCDEIVAFRIMES